MYTDPAGGKTCFRERQRIKKEKIGSVECI